MSERHTRRYFLMLFAATSFAILLLIPATGLSKTITSIASESFAQKAEAISVKDYDAMKNCTTDTSKQPTSIEYLTFFNCGRVSESQDGQTVREFTLILSENKTVDIMDGGYKFKAWTFNGTVPGPTMRVTEGDLVRITLSNPESNTRSHSLHMHSIHPAAMDGVEGEGIVAPGKSFTYEFVAQPFGVYPYHCHVAPVADLVNRGLYGMLIIDPKEPRPQMHEMAMLMNGYDLNFDQEGPNFIPTPEEANNDEMPEIEERGNELYSVNGKAFDYMYHPIELVQEEKYRIYLVNMLEFDLVNSIHIHGGMFEYYPAGTSKTPQMVNDVITLGQGDRGE